MGSDERSLSLSDSDGSFVPSKGSESQSDDEEEADEDPKRPSLPSKGSTRKNSTPTDAKKKPRGASKVCEFHFECFH